MFKRAYIEITNVCNLSCSFCPGTIRLPRFMTVSEFRVIAEKLKPYTGYLYLHVMGEPLLHTGLPDILETAKCMDFRVCITTNGTLLGEKGHILLHPAVHKISVSLHSFEGNETGDITKYLEVVWNFVQSAESKIVSLRLWNQGGADKRNGEIIAFLARELDEDVLKLPLDPNGNRKLRQGLYLESAEKFDWPNLRDEERAVQFCHGLRQQLAVLCDGTVVPCCLDGQGSIPLGNLLKQDMSEILESPRAISLIEGFSRRQPSEELCRHCGYAERFNR